MLYQIVISLILLIYVSTANANQNTTLSNDEVRCYSVAMIGYDYVINSRAGVPLPHALNTVSVNMQSSDIADVYKYELKDVVQKAYLWQGSAHEYAVKTLIHCARQDVY